MLQNVKLVVLYNSFPFPALHTPFIEITFAFPQKVTRVFFAAYLMTRVFVGSNLRKH